MVMHRWTVFAAAAWLTSGCVAIPQHDKVKEVRICSSANCEPATRAYSAEALATGLQHLLKENEGETVTICDSDPKTHACESVGVCYLVFGGIIPGNGCTKSVVFSDIGSPGATGQISLKVNMPLSFIWLPAPCTTTPGALTVRSANEISLEAQPSLCAVLGTGVFKATFNVAVDSLDLTNGRVGGYWSHASAGTGNGRGSGYLVLQFPKHMPQGEKWLVEQPARSAPDAQASGAQPQDGAVPASGVVQSTSRN